MKKSPLILLFLFAFGASIAQEEMSLKQCVDYAMSHNIMLKKSEWEVNKNAQKKKEVLATGLPQINSNNSFNDNLVIPTQLLPAAVFGGPAGTFVPVRFGTKYNLSAGATASQILYDKTFFLGVKASKASEELANLGVEKTKQQLIYDVSSAYYALQVTMVQKGIVENNLTKVKQLLDVSKVQYENGMNKKMDYNRLQVNSTNLETELGNLKLNIDYQAAVLKYVMGLSQDSSVFVSKMIEPKLTKADTSSNSITNNIDIKILQTQMDLNQLNIKQYYAGYFPVLKATATYNWSNMGNEVHLTGNQANWYNSTAIGLSLNFPIFDGMNRHYKANQAKIQQIQMELDDENLKASIRLQNINATNKLATNQSSVLVQQKNMKLAEEIYTTSQEQYNGSIIPLSDLMNAETSLKEAQTNYLVALVQVKLAELELLKASGNIQEIIKQ